MKLKTMKTILMKTENKKQLNRMGGAYKGFSILFLLVFIFGLESFSENHKDKAKVPVKDATNFTLSVNTETATKATTLKTNINVVNDLNAELTLQSENTDSGLRLSNIDYNNIYSSVEHDDLLTVEDWMISESFFVKVTEIKETENALYIESWMINENFWN